MQSAKVIESIVDLSGRIGTADGIYAYIALKKKKKGPLGKPYFITNPAFLHFCSIVPYITV